MHGQGAFNINYNIIVATSMFAGFPNQSPLLTMFKGAKTMYVKFNSVSICQVANTVNTLSIPFQ